MWQLVVVGLSHLIRSLVPDVRPVRRSPFTQVRVHRVSSEDMYFPYGIGWRSTLSRPGGSTFSRRGRQRARWSKPPTPRPALDPGHRAGMLYWLPMGTPRIRCLACGQSVSLGICTVRRRMTSDQGRGSGSDRETPLITGANGPPGTASPTRLWAPACNSLARGTCGTHRGVLACSACHWCRGWPYCVS